MKKVIFFTTTAAMIILAASCGQNSGSSKIKTTGVEETIETGLLSDPLTASSEQSRPWNDQFYIIIDKDGYTNIREKPTTNSKIIDKVVKYEVLFEGDYFCDDLVDIDHEKIPQNWVPVRKDFRTPVGYVFKENVMSFRDMNYLPNGFWQVGGTDTIRCSNGALSVSLIVEPFDFEKHKFELVNMNDVEYTAIDGEYPRGILGYEYTKEALVDEREIKELIINTPEKKYSIPVNACKNYYTPRLMSVFVGPENELYISILFGMDGESFSMMLSVVNGEIVYAKDTDGC